MLFFTFRKTQSVLRKVKNNTCNGYCVLKAELKKIEKAEKKANDILKEKQEIVYVISKQTFNQYNPAFATDIKKVAFCFNSQKTKSVSFKLFHPPIV